MIGSSIKSAMNKWAVEVGSTIKYCPPEARVITGIAEQDAKLYYFEQDSGLQLVLSEDFTNVKGYHVIDELKFTFFVLKWT